MPGVRVWASAVNHYNGNSPPRQPLETALARTHGGNEPVLDLVLSSGD